MEIETGPMQAAVVPMSSSMTKEERARMSAEAEARSEKRAALYAAERAARKKRVEEGGEDEEEGDPYFAAEASKFRDTWNERHSRYDGSFEDTTKIPNKRFTYKKPGKYHCASELTSLQVFSLKVAKIRGGLQWPLQVFGMVAIRDPLDHNRNIIFDRPRDSCQILTQEVPYLKLTGPTRAVLVLDPSIFEVDLKVKGNTESEDKCLSFLAVTYINFQRLDSHLLERDFASKLSTVKFKLGSIVRSVEATIEVRITSGSWPNGFRAQFAAATASIRDAEVMLLDSGDDEVPVAGYARSINLSRCVVSVEARGQLRVCVRALQGDKILVNKKKVFKPKTDGASDGSLCLDFCTLRFTISWSLLAPFRYG